MLTTPSLKDDMLSTPTLTTPRTADWGLFSPVRITAAGSPAASGGGGGSDREQREPPTDLPLDSSIGKDGLYSWLNQSGYTMLVVVAKYCPIP